MGDENRFLCEAIELARANIGKGGRPFGDVGESKRAIRSSSHRFENWITPQIQNGIPRILFAGS